MPARRFRSRADWVSVIWEGATRDLKDNEGANLIRYVTHNISGGHEYWGDAAWDLYRTPETLEEGLLALELRSVIGRALENQYHVIDQMSKSPNMSLLIFGLPMDVGIYMDMVEKLEARDPFLALEYRLRASMVTTRAAFMSVEPFLKNYCYVK